MFCARVCCVGLSGVRSKIQRKHSVSRQQRNQPYVEIVQCLGDQTYRINDGGEEETVAFSQLYRKENPFSKDELKRFFRESATQEPYKDAPWIVRKHLTAKHGLPDALPTHLADAKEQVELNRKRRRSGAPADGTGAGAAVRGKSRGKPAPRVKIRYPIEDSDLRKSDRKEEGPYPALSTAFAHTEHIPHVLSLWDFFITFGETLRISPFSLQDFEGALKNTDGRNQLLAHCVVALVNTVLTMQADDEDGEPADGVDSRNEEAGLGVQAAAPRIVDAQVHNFQESTRQWLVQHMQAHTSTGEPPSPVCLVGAALRRVCKHRLPRAA